MVAVSHRPALEAHTPLVTDLHETHMRLSHVCSDPVCMLFSSSLFVMAASVTTLWPAHQYRPSAPSGSFSQTPPIAPLVVLLHMTLS